ncbi:MAG: zinc ribbon domain-containing protein [Oscillospiraceae bacterium]
MKIKCSYCGSYISDTDEKCPNCGAVNEALVRSAEGVPKTIEELKAFCAKHGLPLEKMRFFIGEDYKSPKAFGIYRDSDGCFVVYKNKADGTRAVRYRGADEAYAVNEIYQKMKSEILKRKKPGVKSPAPYEAAPRRRRRSFFFKYNITLAAVAAFFAIFYMLLLIIAPDAPRRGYYTYEDSCYYYSNDDWYVYDDGWAPAYSVDSELTDNYEGYYEGISYSSDYGATDFEDSGYYHEYDQSNDWDNDWDDDDWDVDYDSWDDYDSDWDSDW